MIDAGVQPGGPCRVARLAGVGRRDVGRTLAGSRRTVMTG